MSTTQGHNIQFTMMHILIFKCLYNLHTKVKSTPQAFLVEKEVLATSFFGIPFIGAHQNFCIRLKNNRLNLRNCNTKLELNRLIFFSDLTFSTICEEMKQNV